MTPTSSRWFIDLEGAVAGFLQIWENNDPDYRHAGLDLALHPRFQGRGLGPAAIRMACRWLFDHGHHGLTIDPAAENIRARRAYEGVEQQRRPDLVRRIAHCRSGQRTGPHGCSELLNTLHAKVGFREVGRLRSYQWDSTRADWVDGILYDLLEDDLTYHRRIPP